MVTNVRDKALRVTTDLTQLMVNNSRRNLQLVLQISDYLQIEWLHIQLEH